MNLNIRDVDEKAYKKIRAIMAFQGEREIGKWVKNALNFVIADYEKHNGTLDPYLERTNDRSK